MNNNNNSIYLVDGSSLAFRSFFALITSGLRRADGLPTWAVIGFYNSLFELIEKRNPHHLLVSFDLAEPTFRHESFADYKANRAEMPDDLSVQWPIIKEGIKVLGIPNYELAGYEADDIIGTIAKDAERKGMKTVIFTGDKDSFQLLDDSISVLMPTTNEGVKIFDRQEVFNKLGVWPEQVIDYKGLVGDASDNIPGVRGIGPKTAVQLLTEYKTVEGVYENLANIKSNSVRTKLETGKESAFNSKDLATIRLDVPIDFDYEHCRLSMPDVDAVVDYFRSVEANSILRRLPRLLKYFNGGTEPEIDPARLEPVGKPPRSGMSRSSSGSAKKPQATQEDNQQASRSGVAVAEYPTAQAQSAARTTKYPTLNPPQPALIRNEAELDDLVKVLAQQQLVGIQVLKDSTHTLDGNIVGIGLAWNDQATLTEAGRPNMPLDKGTVQTAYISIAHKTEEHQLPAATVIEKLKPIVSNDKIGKTSFDAKASINGLSRAGLSYQPTAFDPMLASYVVDPDENHRLKEQALHFFNYNLTSAVDILGTGKKQLAWDYVPASTASTHACDVARLSLLLSAVYNDRLDSDQQDLLFEMDLPFCEVLATMEQTGLKIDSSYFEAFSVELAGDLARLEQEIYQLAGRQFNIGSPLQLQTVLFKELNLPTGSKTKSGYSTDASVLEELAKEHEIARKILEWRHLSKLKSTYVDALPREISPLDGRVHGEFNQASTSTGRLSSTNPNLQNIPIRTKVGQRIRQGFIATDDQHILLAADYSQIELRLLAHMSGDEKLIDAFQNDQDIHARTASDIFAIPIEQVTSEQRGIGKTLNFALVYQQGAFATGQSLGIPTKQAQEFITKYFAAYPKVRAFQVQVINEARANGYVQTLWGRRRFFKNLNDRNDMVRKQDERAAFNAPLQGSAADLIKRAMIRLDKVLKERQLKTKLILQVHDELVLDVPKSELDEVKQVVMSAMSADESLLRVPLKVDVGAASNWMEC